jgi:hypothetical protein
MSCLGVSSCFICGLASICISIIGFENRRRTVAIRITALAAVEETQGQSGGEGGRVVERLRSCAAAHIGAS